MNNEGYAVSILIKAGAEIDAKDNRGNTPLHNAACFGLLNAVTQLCENNADVNAKNNDDETPLHSAAGGSSIGATGEVAQALLEKGADVDAKDKSGETPLFKASFNAKIIPILLEYRANVKMENEDKETALHRFAYHGKVDAMAALFEGSEPDLINVNARNKYGQTPLHRATIGDKGTGYQFLIEKGADVKAEDNSQRTPLDGAMYYNGSTEVLSLVMKGIKA